MEILSPKKTGLTLGVAKQHFLVFVFCFFKGKNNPIRFGFLLQNSLGCENHQFFMAKSLGGFPPVFLEQMLIRQEGFPFSKIQVITNQFNGTPPAKI